MPDSPDPLPSDPVQALATWWGEDLSASLIDRITSGPVTHYWQFWQDYMASYTEPKIPSISFGTLRPLVSEYNLSVLLYSPQIVTFNPLARSPIRPSFHTTDLRRNLETLQFVSPLIQKGIVHLIDPSYVTFSRATPETKLEVDDEFEHSLERVASLVETTGPGYAAKPLYELLESREGRELIRLASLLQHQARHSDAFQLGLNKDEYRLLGGILAQGLSGQHRSRLAQLLEMQLPFESFPQQAILDIRETEAFSDWTERLNRILDDLGGLEDRPDWPVVARKYAQTNLAPFKKQLEREIGRSGRQPFVANARSLTIGALGTASGIVVGGGSVAGAAAGLATSAAASLAADVISQTRARRSARSLLQHCLVFD